MAQSAAQCTALQLLKNVTVNNTHVLTAAFGTAVPNDLKGMRVGGSAENARRILRLVSKEVTEDQLEADSAHRLSVQAEATRRYTTWASGEGDAFRRFKSDTVTTFFDQLFQAVCDLTAGWGDLNAAVNGDDGLTRQRLNRKDLFHGHLRVDRSGATPDLVMVFHAKEFPSDTAAAYSDMADAFYDAAGVDDAPGFASRLRCNEIRNSVWSLTKNRIWSIRYRRNAGLVADDHPYRCLLGTPWDNQDGGGYSSDDLELTGQPVDPLKLAEEFLGEDVCNVNCFVGETVSSFVKMRSE